MPTSTTPVSRQAACSLTADAVVVAARPDGARGLEFRPNLCAGCAGTCLWRRLQATRIDSLPAIRHLKPGTVVTVALPERSVLHASMLLHGMPLAAILLGAAAGTAVTATDGGALLGAVAGLAIALAAFRPLGRRLERMTLAQLSVSTRA
jgi:positive regulator of sigma E activity